MNSDWFTSQFVPVVIGRSTCFVLVFRRLFETALASGEALEEIGS